MMIENEQARPWVRPVHGLPDEAFLRGKAPMTKQEIRSVALSKLAPSADAVVCDIGAGTGSCTVELALQAPFGHVYAFEINEEALDVLRENIGHFDLSNVTVVAGDASQTCHRWISYRTMPLLAGRRAIWPSSSMTCTAKQNLPHGRHGHYLGNPGRRHGLLCCP